MLISRGAKLSLVIGVIALVLTIGVVLLVRVKKDSGESLVPIKVLPKKIIDPNSLNWVKVDIATGTTRWAKRDSHAVYVFDGKLWLSGGLDSDNAKVGGTPDYEKALYYNDIWNSEDGLTWNRVVSHADFPDIRSHSVIYFKDALYMYGGWSPKYGQTYKNGIWKSTDGINWVQVVKNPEYPDREGQKVVEFNGKLWLVGGVNYFGRKTFNDVWSSEDGIHWTLVTKNAPWHSRWDFDIGIFDGKMWLAGGMGLGGAGYGDVWSTTDGAHWDLVTELAPWGKRQGQEIVEYRGYMWLVTGLDAVTNEGKGDTWYTADGKIWSKAPQDDKWLGREDQAVIVFKDKIWVLGGMDSAWHWNDDVWHTEFNSVFETDLASTTQRPNKIVE